MSRIDETFRRLKKEGRAALIPFVVAGDPDLETTAAVVDRMARCGADIIELGVPYSDPLADGPTIQAASHRALQKGVTLADVLDLAGKMPSAAPPLVVMTYYNPVFRYGLEKFALDCRDRGVAGVIIPDLPPEEAGPWIREARKENVDTIFLAAPTSPPGRIQLADRCSRGFLYYVSLTGVTGTRRELPADLDSVLRDMKACCRRPVAVGFGLSTPAQARAVAAMADGVIVGSAIIQIMENRNGREERVEQVGGFVSALAAAVRG